MRSDPLFKETGFICSEFGPTNKSGVYAICVLKRDYIFDKTKKFNVVYIGSSKSVSKRVLSPNHIYRRIINVVQNYIVCCFYLECGSYLELEKKMIKKYKPRFNKAWLKD